MTRSQDSFGTFDTLRVGNKSYGFFNLKKLEDRGIVVLDRLPYSLRVLLENLLRNEDGRLVRKQDVEHMLAYDPVRVVPTEIPYMPARVVMQDFTGVPAVVDLAALRDAMVDMNGDPGLINPVVRTDLVIDHSVQVDAYGSDQACAVNTHKEIERNRERYALLRWAQGSLKKFRVVPPGTGIVHQVNLEYLADVVTSQPGEEGEIAFFDTLVGTDSHTTMINGLSIFGWGVGGIEAEAVMLGQPYYLVLPEVIGFRLTGELPRGSTATDLVLTVTEMLRSKGVVGKFVEFYGPGLNRMSIADRATISNMSPEYGATMGFFPIDGNTLDYLRLTGRDDSRVSLIEAYARVQGMFRSEETPDPEFTDSLELDLGAVESSIAGPRRPQDRIALSRLPESFGDAMENFFCPAIRSQRHTGVDINLKGEEVTLLHGSVVIAAITSCTNTSNPSVMVAAGLLAKNALKKGLRSKSWVKTSLAPGSQVVPEYLAKAGLLEPLAEQGFNLVAFGCTTCIGNSGPLPPEVDRAVTEGDLVVAAVLSGNRNFEGRIHPQVRASYLASPPLVVAYALAGYIDFDFDGQPLGQGPRGDPIYLRDVWPTEEQIRRVVSESLSADMFVEKYADVFKGDADWNTLDSGRSQIYPWNPASTYIKKPPFFQNLLKYPEAPRDIANARVLLLLGDTVTTDHISPAGTIPCDGPAGRYLIENDVAEKDFNSFGSRRGNHEVMKRGTFANIRIRNLLVPGVEGGLTQDFVSGDRTSVYDASLNYRAQGIPLIVIAGKEYGTGSSRDWAAKGTMLLGVKAVLAESYERIHRGNLIGMGVLPLQFQEGQSLKDLGLDGKESYTITGISAGLEPRQILDMTAISPDGKETRFQVKSRLDTPVEVGYYRNGGILPTVLRGMLPPPDED